MKIKGNHSAIKWLSIKTHSSSSVFKSHASFEIFKLTQIFCRSSWNFRKQRRFRREITSRSSSLSSPPPPLEILEETPLPTLNYIRCQIKLSTWSTIHQNFEWHFNWKFIFYLQLLQSSKLFWFAFNHETHEEKTVINHTKCHQKILSKENVNIVIIDKPDNELSGEVLNDFLTSSIGFS